jgi:DNA-binding MarR family transcriptional regulator
MIVEQRSVLKLIAERTRAGKPTSYRSLVRELGLSVEAACGHLKRLWRERLIESSDRPERFRYRLEPGESMRDLRFELSDRGRERLRWYREKEEKDEGGWFS